MIGVVLPSLLAEITEYQGHARTCPGCGAVTRARIPQEIGAHGCGPNLTATIAYLTGKQHLSKRAVEEISADVFGAPISLGTIAALEQEVSGPGTGSCRGAGGRAARGRQERR